MTTRSVNFDNPNSQDKQWVNILGTEIQRVLNSSCTGMTKRRNYIWPWLSGDRQIIRNALKQLLLLSCELPLFNKINDAQVEDYSFDTGEMTVLFQKLEKQQGENAWAAFIDSYVKWFRQKGRPQFYRHAIPQLYFPEWSIAFYSLLHALLFAKRSVPRDLSWFADVCLRFDPMDWPTGLELDDGKPLVEKNRTYKVGRLPANISLAIGNGNAQNLINQINYIGADRKLLQYILQELLNLAKYDVFEEIVQHFEVPFPKENRLEMEHMRWCDFWQGDDWRMAVNTVDSLEPSNPLIHFLNQKTDAFFCNAALYVLYIKDALSPDVIRDVLNNQSRPYQVMIPGLKPLFLAGYMAELLEELPEASQKKAYEQLLYHFSPYYFNIVHDIRKNSVAGEKFFSSKLP